MTAPARDLVVLVPDKNFESAMLGILARPKSLGIRPVAHQVLVHPERDPGVLLRGPELLKPHVRSFSHALALFDRQGCGRENESPGALETDLGNRLTRSGWDNRAAVVVVDPELEMWVWSDSPHLAESLWWPGPPSEPARSWLAARGLWIPGNPKPHRPKEALETVLRHVKRPRSSSIYREIADKVSLDRCRDSSFLRFKEILSTWFGAEP